VKSQNWYGDHWKNLENLLKKQNSLPFGSAVYFNPRPRKKRINRISNPPIRKIKK
jgi:hypothetical protein